ncbi:MAG: class II SORL domain-containing protein [Candidatus Omnitrophota bacterium]
MAELKDLFQVADWKKEKHVPVIEVADTLKKGEFTQITVSVGKEIPHPNTTEHHIRWLAAYFLPDGEKFPYELGGFEFSSHGESVQGPNSSTVYTHSQISFSFKTDKPGTLMAASYCNIHGLWQSNKSLKIE